MSKPNILSKKIKPREEMKLSLFIYETIVHEENPKDPLNLLALIYKYNKVIAYKVNTPKSIVLLYTSTRQLEFEIKRFKIIDKMKNIYMNLGKYAKFICREC
jgi:hypothetical protein